MTEYEYPHADPVEEETTPIPPWSVDDFRKAMELAYGCITVVRDHCNANGVSFNSFEETYARIRHAYEAIKSQETGSISDGYHTYNELYDHRAKLFAIICRNYPSLSWKSKKHADGTMYDGMFIVGILTPSGQATYHYDIDPYWDLFNVVEIECAPEWDGHTPEDAIERISKLPTPFLIDPLMHGMKVLAQNSTYGLSKQQPHFDPVEVTLPETGKTVKLSREFLTDPTLLDDPKYMMSRIESEHGFGSDAVAILAQSVYDGLLQGKKQLSVSRYAHQVKVDAEDYKTFTSMHLYDPLTKQYMPMRVVKNRHAKAGEIIYDKCHSAICLVACSYFEQQYTDKYGVDSPELLKHGTNYVDAIEMESGRRHRIQYYEYFIVLDDEEYRVVFNKNHREHVQLIADALEKKDSDVGSS